jgi:hypothetical protein
LKENIKGKYKTCDGNMKSNAKERSKLYLSTVKERKKDKRYE